MPTNKMFRYIDDVNPDASEIEKGNIVKEWARHYKTFYIDKDHSGPLERTLQVYDFFRVLEALPVKWSRLHYWKCNCSVCFYHAGCHHVLLASMVVDKDIRVPPQYVAQSLQQRKKRGRPCVRENELSEDREIESRDKTKLSSRREEYQHPTVNCFTSCHCECI